MSRKEKLIGVQYLRAVAALMVAYYHLQGQIPGFTQALSFDRILSSAHLASGVYIFFVISGFIMYVTARKLTTEDFAWKRLIRILPLYWSLTLAVCIVAFLDPHGLHRTDVTLGYLAKSLFFIPYANPTQNKLLFPILVPGWSLNYEMFFYVIFAVSLLAPARFRMWLAGVIIATIALIGTMCSRPEMMDVIGFYTSSHVLLFGFGILLGASYSRLQRPQLPRWACAILVIGGFWVLLADFQVAEMDRLAQFVGPIAIVAGAVAWEHQYGLPRWKIPLLLGDASYSIYLVHLFAFGLVRQLWKHVALHGGTSDAVTFGVVSMMVAVGLALVTYQAIERPTLRLLTRRRETSAGLQQLAA